MHMWKDSMVWVGLSLIILGVGGCGLIFMDGARSVEAGVWVIG